jgi:cold shock CspA family protein
MSQARHGPRAPVTGTVVAFDEARGLGAVEGADGCILPFHCTAISDGTRRIEVGTKVVFTRMPGHVGRIEARAIAPIE